MSAQDFLRRVEQSGLVSEPLLAELRKRTTETHRNMRPEMLAKLLVDRGELTAAQARKLVADTAAARNAPPPLPPEADAPPEPEEELQLATDDDELGFAPEVDLTDSSGGNLPDDLLADEPLADDLLDDGTSSFKLVEDDEQDDEDELTLQSDDEVEEGILLDNEDDAIEIVDEGPSTPPSATASAEPTPVLDDILGDPVADIPDEVVVIRRKKSFAQTIANLFGGGRRPKKKSWDSPLILLGGGALILLIAAGVGLFGLFYGESADEIFTAGVEAYESQSYGLAIKNFERLSTQYAQHEKASLARVRIEMSRLRQLTDTGSPNWEDALSQAKSGLNTIKTEASFSEVRSELAKLLPDISAGLVEASQKAENTQEKQRVLDLAVASLTMVNNPEFLPTSVRKSQEIRIGEIVSNIDVVRRDIERELALSGTIDEIKAAASAGEISKAYALRDTLVRTYPLLIDNVALSDVIGTVIAREKDAVQTGPGTQQPSTDDHPPASRFNIVLSDQRGGEISGLDDTIGVLVRGAVYALNASNGRALWRRHVGYEASVFPQKVTFDQSGDLLTVDGKRSELVRLDDQTGKLLWRLPCPRPVQTPAIYGEQAFVSCGTGTESRLLLVNLNDGTVSKETRFPVGCETPPTVIAERMEIVQPGIHSSVYVLDASSLECKSVFSSGHAHGSIKVPAAWVGTSLVVAENDGTATTNLQVYTPLGEKDQWGRVGENIKLSGQVTTPFVVDDRRLLTTTELGEIRVLEAPIDSTGLREVASIADTGKSIGSSFSAMSRASLWVANRTFSRFELQSTRGRLVSQWSRDRTDRFLNPLITAGNYLFHVRRRNGMQGATVSAIATDSTDGSPIWETDIGVPSTIVVNSQSAIHSVTMNGAMFEIDSNAVTNGVTGERSSRIDPRLLPQAFSDHFRVDADTHIFASPPPLKHVVVAGLTEGNLERIPLRLEGDSVSVSPVAMGNSLLAPSAAGPIYLLDATNGKQRFSPFMPRTAPRADIGWLRPATIGSNQFIAAEKSGQLYRVAANNEMTLEEEATLEGEIIAGLAATGNIAYAVVRIGGSEQVAAINAEDLKVASTTMLQGGLSWGPKRVGELVVVADADRNIYAFDNTGNTRWKLENGPVPLSGNPLAMGRATIFTSTDGDIATVDASGQVIAQKRFGEPLGSGPVAYRGKLLIAGWDGTLFLVNVPQ